MKNLTCANLSLSNYQWDDNSNKWVSNTFRDDLTRVQNRTWWTHKNALNNQDSELKIIQSQDRTTLRHIPILSTASTSFSICSGQISGQNEKPKYRMTHWPTKSWFVRRLPWWSTSDQSPPRSGLPIDTCLLAAKPSNRYTCMSVRGSSGPQ